MAMVLKNLLNVEQLSRKQIIMILEKTDYFKEIIEKESGKLPLLAGKTIVNLFYEPSTRTRTSFEIAAKKLSADVLNFVPDTSSLKKGESELDTIKTILAMKTDLLVVRHKDSGFLKYISDNINLPMINAGDGRHCHPTQSLLDLYTINAHFKRLEKIKIAIVGDIVNSRVARSDITLFTEMGAEVVTVAPSMFLPEDMSCFKTENFYCIDDVIESCDVVYMLRMQLERQDKKFFPSAREYNRFFSINNLRFEKMKKNAILMHPGPVNRGIELNAEILNREGNSPDRIKICEQVTNGVALRMALLSCILS